MTTATMDKTIYLTELDKLKNELEALPKTSMATTIKIQLLILMNMRYEKVAFNRAIQEHPYVLTQRIIQDTRQSLAQWKELLFTEAPNTKSHQEALPDMEDKHQKLFNILWNQYDLNSYQVYVERYQKRIQINQLEPLIKGKRCIDFGCGNGNFCFALAIEGAQFVAGIDFGDASIAFANKMKEHQKCGDRCEFKTATVYETGYPAESFDFAIQNGVFHHVHDELKAIREANRILKKGGYFWYYTDGEGGISYDLWDTSVHLLREVPSESIQRVLKSFNISVSKEAHILDGLKATYRHTSYDKITKLLAQGGFGNFKRLVGGFDTDFDHDVIAKDPYGVAKFGEGDLRILAQKIN